MHSGYHCSHYLIVPSYNTLRAIDLMIVIVVLDCRCCQFLVYAVLCSSDVLPSLP